MGRAMRDMIEKRRARIAWWAALSLFLLAVAGLDSRLGGVAAQPATDRPGGEYFRFELGSGDPAECALRCERDRRCKAWSFSYPTARDAAACSLKNTVPRRVESACCISGVRGAGVVEPRSGGIETSIDRFGGDYRNFEVKSDTPAETCRDACAADPKCRAWTYARPGYGAMGPRCYLKSQIKPPRRKPCCVSGVVR